MACVTGTWTTKCFANAWWMSIQQLMVELYWCYPQFTMEMALINDFPIQDGDFTRGYIPVIGGFFHEIPMKYREYLFGSVLPHLPTMSFCFWHPMSGLCQSEPPRAVHVSPRITGAKSKNCNPRPLQNDCLYVARPLIEMTSRDWIRMCCWLFPWNLRQKQNLLTNSPIEVKFIQGISRDQWNCRWFPHWHTPLTSDFWPRFCIRWFQGYSSTFRRGITSHQSVGHE